MSAKGKKPSKNKKKSNPSNGDSDKEAVGFGKPPKHTQFKKGQSGNPGGRPVGSKNLRNLIYQYADKEIEVITREGKQIITRREAAADKIWEAMLKKPDRQTYLLYMEIEAEKEKEREEYLKNLEDRKDLDCVHAMLFEILGYKSPIIKKHVLEMLENGDFDDVEVDNLDKIKSIYLPKDENMQKKKEVETSKGND